MPPTLTTTTEKRLIRRLRRLYPEAAATCLERLRWLLGRFPADAADHPSAWSERDAVLITYADAVRREGEAPLRTLKRLLDERLAGAVSTVHLLPFYPWSSDDGFSVIKYWEVDPAAGRWADVERLGEKFNLMFDLVLNHVSRQSPWFRDYVNGLAPARDYFIEANPATDLSAVVRPRSRPLLTEFNTRSGRRWLWTTFSEDQIDLNFANPDVLFEFLEILLLYVARGARIIRLDAIAFLWKEIGTNCLHHRLTHEVVKLLRDVVEIAAPGTLLLTETNVPHAENTSYFGRGDEAHMIYQFSLPPLVMHALQAGTATWLNAWAAALPPAPPGCAYFNFTASHDGVGVRPLEGLLPADQQAWMIERVKRCGGNVSTRRAAAGADVPYELNISYFDAMRDPELPADPAQVPRFLCSQAIALAMPGMPGIYLHSFTATPNDQAGVEATGRHRSINRRKWREAELRERLDEPDGIGARVFNSLVAMLQARRSHPAFHPEADFRVLAAGDAIFAIVRQAADGRRVIALHHVGHATATVDLGQEAAPDSRWHDLITGAEHPAGPLTMTPHQVLWLAEETH